MTNPRRTGLRRLWYVASWRCRYWYLDTREGLVARIVLALGLLVAAVWSAWASLQQMQRPPVAGEPIKAIADWIVYAIVFVVSLLVAYALAPKPQSAKPQKIEVARVEDGATLKRIYGPVWISDPVVIGDKPMGTVAIRKKAGKSLTLKTKWQTVGYWYKRIFHFMLCRGPIDSVLAIRAGDKEVWSGELGESSNLFISRLNLWGGEDSEGGIEGVFEFKFGDADQEPSAYLAANLAPEQSAYRGRASVVFQGGRWGNSPYFKSPAFLVSRTREGWDNDECWYPEKAEVPVGYGPLELLISEIALKGSDADGSGANAYVLNDVGPQDLLLVTMPEGLTYTAWSGWGSDDSTTPTPPPAPGHVWLPAFWVTTDTGTTAYNQTFHTSAAGAFAAAQANLPINLSGASSYRFWLYDPYPPDNRGGLSLRVHRQRYLVGMNAAHVLYDSLVAREMDGEPAALIDDSGWRAAADRLHAEGFGIGTEFDASSETIEQFQQRLCDLIGAQLSRDPTTGLWHLDLIRDDIGVDDLPVLTDDDILEFERQPAVLDEAVNQVVVEWFDPLKKENRSTAPLQALGAIQAFGSVNGEVRTFREILNETLALRVGARDLRVRSTPLERITASTTRAPYSWRKGRKFRLQAPKKGIADMVCVLGEVDRGTLRSGALRITAVQDVASMPDTTYVVGEPGTAPEIPTTAVPVPSQALFESPYSELFQVLSDADLAYLSPTQGYVLAVAAAAPAAVDFLLQTQVDGGGFEEAQPGSFCPTATVVEASLTGGPAGGLLRVDFTLAAPSGLEGVELGTAALWGDELCRVDALDVMSLTVTLGRGVVDTPPTEHAAGERIWFYDAYGVMDPEVRSAGQQIDAKAQTRMGSDILELYLAPVSSVIMASRASRPYAPGKLEVNGESYPVGALATTEVTWSHRDRLAQEAALIDALAEGFGPEIGTTYTVRWILNGVLDHEETGIAGTAAAHTPSGNGTLRIEVWAVRDGLESWKPAAHTLAFLLSPLEPYVDESDQTYADQDGNVYEG
ncbi:hypothetical protein CSC62_07580 [Pseudoxanthomonas jiangsuensis]|uniref:phage tail protein n=1 Tax=Pseudoxanthomonas jiangsuensis TaxID=619688 RepID=UPI0013909806|nr:phage tail protein [Pseudoxanthomonas jiangsuensis]KAF1697997.1 hypothetical protein CSC62_07580 [Pseudoxanthomonas jiangsuensis]